MTDPEAEGQGPASEPATSTMPLRQARLLVFTTSAAVLVLEILAGRLVAPHVGVSLETFTAIIGTVLAGIAVGNTVGGQLADRHPPIRLIGPALVIAGAGSGCGAAGPPARRSCPRGCAWRATSRASPS